MKKTVKDNPASRALGGVGARMALRIFPDNRRPQFALAPHQLPRRLRLAMAWCLNKSLEVIEDKARPMRAPVKRIRKVKYG